MRGRGLWESGAALMSRSGWNDGGWRGSKIEGQRGPVARGGRSEEIFGDLVGCGRECNSDRGR